MAAPPVHAAICDKLVAIWPRQLPREHNSASGAIAPEALFHVSL
jgi:hypothetical protein